MKQRPLCENMQIELQDFKHIKIFGLTTNSILFLKEFYVMRTGDTDLKKLAERTTEKGFQG